MGLLTTSLSPGPTAALWPLLCLAACAVAPPPQPLAPVPSGFGCRAERGTAEGLILRLDVPATLAPDALVGLERDGEIVGQVAASELPEVPYALRVGDAAVAPGDVILYECWLAGGGEVVERVRFEAEVPALPARPAAPEAVVAGGRVRIGWHAEGDVWVQVLRRDVLASGEAVAISPRLATPGWEDADALPGRVYAYALRAARFAGDVPWESGVGPERYVEMPE